MALDPEVARALLAELVEAGHDDPISKALDLATELLESVEEERGAGRSYEQLLERNDPDALTIQAAWKQHRFLSEAD
jgi:hypothetical protein